jgi:hypothetical protein
VWSSSCGIWYEPPSPQRSECEDPGLAAASASAPTTVVVVSKTVHPAGAGAAGVDGRDLVLPVMLLPEGLGLDCLREEESGMTPFFFDLGRPMRREGL